MTPFYKVVDGGYIAGIGTNGSDSVTAISEAEYKNLLSLIKSAPSAPSGYTYKLRADNLEWELVELPPIEPEPSTVEDKAEAYDILMGEGESE